MVTGKPIKPHTMDVNLSKLMAKGQPTAEDLHKELLQSAWKDHVSHTGQMAPG